MEKEALIRKVVEAIGAKDSKSKIVFNTFIRKLSVYLGNDEAIKLEGIGTFQLKKEPISRLERGHSDHPRIEKMKIFYSPIVDEIPDDSDKLFLSFDVETESEDPTEFNEDVFDLGLDKPLIPLDKTVDEIVDEIDREEIDSLTDEKLNQLIEDGEKLDGFELFDKLMGEPSADQTTDNDKDDKIEIVEQLIEDGDEDNNINADEDLQDDLLNDEIESEEVEDPFAKLEDLLEREESKENMDENDAEEVTDGLDESDDLTEMESETWEISPEENDEGEIIFEEEAEHPESEDESEDITAAIEKDTLEKEFDKIEESEIDDNKPRDPFDELEDYLGKDESNEDIKDEEKEDEQVNDDEVNEEDKTEVEADKEDIIRKYNDAKFNYSQKHRKTERRPLIWVVAAAAMVVIYLMIVYFPQDEQQAVIPPSKVLGTEAPITSTEDGEKKSDESNIIKDKEVKTSKPIDVVKKSTIPKQTGLYRDIPQDKRVTDRIYYNGKYYTVQVSSWRTVKIAEREVNRYRNLGFDAFIYQVFIKSKGGTWNRVRIGYFNSKDEAEEFIQSNKL